MHVTDDDILLYLEDKLSLEEKEKLQSHVGSCAACATLFAGLSRLPSVLREDIPIEVDRTTLRRARESVGDKNSKGLTNFMFFRPRFRLAFGALSVFVAAIVVYVFVQKHEPSQFRSAERLQPEFTFHPPDGAVVSELRPVFRWSADPQTSAYRFMLMDNHGRTLWIADVRDTTVAIPSSVVLMPGKTYLWRVESFLSSKSPERSSVHAFIYSPPQ